jgi:hypothetical protein
LAIFSAVAVQAVLCSAKRASLTVTTSADIDTLIQAALCPHATINAIWQGEIQPLKTIVVGNGTSLQITGDAIGTSVINGGGKIRLFDVWGKLSIRNMTVINGYVKSYRPSDGGGAIRVQPSAELNITGSTLVNNIATASNLLLAVQSLLRHYPDSH